MPSVLELKAIAKRFAAGTGVSDIAFCIEAGEAVALLGPNGAGKTTTLRMVLGLIRPDRGEIWINGVSVLHDRAGALAHTGAIVEESRFYGYLTGFQNIRQAVRLRNLDKDRTRIMERLEQVGLDHAAHRPVRQYSLGMRQRLALALALLQDPRLLVLDEPMNGLDPEAMRDLRQQLQQLAADGVAILLSSHLLSEVEQLCTRVLIIQEGRLVSEESTGLIERSATQIELTVDPVDEALAILAAWQPTPGRVANQIRLNIAYQSIPDIVVRLTTAGIRIYRVAETAAQLEERYLSIAGRSKT
ncbi:MAG: ABC transporter ATP-binding protein [Thermaerobacter sp.]|nr:ABC transporter ATP-binding protein [Thermaerobacter sp.]